KWIKWNFLISVRIIKASSRVVIGRGMIVMGDESGLLKRNKRMAGGIGVGIGVRGILSRLNGIIEGLRIGIRGLVGYKRGGYVRIK
ncbi:hypothetical protein, partial [Staphylococcus warneri]|uniref:hypothetical protein n=1 Tax=Staphylococcus warneri TaxID=1292 RepID=UPI001C930EC1